MWYLNSGESEFELYLLSEFQASFIFSPAINPILYNLMSSKFREGFLKLLKCKPLIRTTSWSEGTRKGTFHTASTNLSSSNHGNAVNSASEIVNNRLRFAANRNELSTVKTVERAPLNVIKYVKIVVDEKIADTLDINEDISDGELDVENLGKIKARRQRREDEEAEESEEGAKVIRIVNPSSRTNSNRFLIKSNSVNSKACTPSIIQQQKNNYCNTNEENVKIPINSCNNDKCLPDDNDKVRVVETVGEEIDQQTTNSTTNHDKKDFCINIYNLLSAKESLV